MCFYNDDYDWTAEVHDESGEVCVKPATCFECSGKILPGQWCKCIHQQEHELCQLCEDDSSDVYDETPQPDCKHYYGETYDYVCCVGCAKIQAAIWEHERKENCPEHSRSPSLGGLYEEVFSYHQDAEEYKKACLSMFPELAGHPYLELVTND